MLLVDDEEDFVRTMAERLELRGVDTLIALSGEAALRILAESPPDVAVLDVRLPDMDGMHLLKRLKDQRPSMEVIILTGQGCDKVDARAKLLGAFGCFPKPVDMDQLMSAVRSAGRASEERAP